MVGDQSNNAGDWLRSGKVREEAEACLRGFAGVVETSKLSISATEVLCSPERWCTAPE